MIRCPGSRLHWLASHSLHGSRLPAGARWSAAINGLTYVQRKSRAYRLRHYRHPSGGRLRSEITDLVESYEQLEQARRQVLQEQELRSVAEGCLTEDRMYAQTMQSMAADAHHRCATSLQLLNSLGQAHNELCRRTDASPVHVSSPTDDTLASALREGLQLDGPRHNNNTESNSEIRHLATGQLTRAIKGIHQEILSQITIAAIVTSKLATCDDIDSAVKASSNEQPEQYL